VNGSRVDQHILTPGDCIRIGNAVLEVHGTGEDSSSNQLAPTDTTNPQSGGQTQENQATLHKRLQRRAQTEQKVKCMIQLLASFSNSRPSRSRTCRVQDRFCGEKDERILRTVADWKSRSGTHNKGDNLRMRLLLAIQRERRNRLSFYRRTARYLRRSERSRRRLQRSWESKFVKK